jgi:hypothetical protein
VLGAQQDDARRDDEQPDDPRAPDRHAERCQVPRGTYEVRILGRRSRDPPGVRDEDPDQHDRVERRDRVLERQRQAVHGREREERDLDGVRALEPDLVTVGRRRRRRRVGPPAHPPHAPPRDEHDHRPAEADQQPIGAGHVRERERAVGRPGRARRPARRPVRLDRIAALQREHHVDRVLGQHRDEREHRDREAGRDVELRDLRRPRQEERGADDREPEQQRRERLGHVRIREAEREPGGDDGEGERERDPLPCGTDVAEVWSERRHGFVLLQPCNTPCRIRAEGLVLALRARDPAGRAARPW